MKRTKKNEKRNLKPVKISESLRGINQKILYKFGKLDYIIHAKWHEIVGTFFIHHSEPLKIISVPISENLEEGNIYKKYLHVNVSPSIAIEFQHFQNKIIEKINSFLGYQAIHGLKIHQKLVKKNIPSHTNTNTHNKDMKNKKNEIINTTTKINDKELEESLINLGLSISKEE